jgi:hypothetical protein
MAGFTAYILQSYYLPVLHTSAITHITTGIIPAGVFLRPPYVPLF